MRPGILTLTTDFGASGPYVAAVKGVVLGLAPGVQIVDVSHAVAPQNILEGAFVLATVVDAFPPETVHLAVLQGDVVVTLLKREGRHAVRVDTGALGAADAAHATALGKAMLAWLPEHELRRIVAARGMARFTPSTITEPDALIEDLRLVRRHSHAVEREEHQPGVTGIGAAIRDHLGAVVGAISVSAPTLRATDSPRFSWVMIRQ